MAEDLRTSLQNLIALGKVDIALARILAEKKQLTERFAKKTTDLRQAENNLALKMKVYNERKARFDKEENSIKEEREKLVARRKSLASLNNYKVQQAAEKEIEHANRSLSVREEAMLESLGELEAAISENKAMEDAVVKHRAEKAELEAEIKAIFPELESKEKNLRKEREKRAALVLPAYMHNYDRIKSQYFGDAIVPVNMQSKSCSGCFIQIRPQIIVELHKGDKIVNCPGCGRIIYIEETQSEG
ncbi:MAG: hypothetical protein GYA55_06065 [SAR324 cluster bacterium]|uniref:C4-type zinc ribbon domain-containing protein n=1 Tax=SAR324 cluster bacterium TaxID=2024889 RepID=A0A7X9FR22_9DELT|nr:hypothetical protein [SAR324 cluster bacterium]